MKKKKSTSTLFGLRCKAAGLTAYRISKDTGVSLQTVANWMSGNARPRLSEDVLTVLAYCRAKGVDVTLEDMMR